MSQVARELRASRVAATVVAVDRGMSWLRNGRCPSVGGVSPGNSGSSASGWSSQESLLRVKE